MTELSDSGTTLADELRRAFDEAFARSPQQASDPGEAFLGIRVSGDAYAVRLAEIAGLFVDRKIVALPSSTPSLLGLAGVRGAVVPVYDLRALLGYPSASNSRWLILSASAPALALAFDAFDGHLRVPREERLPASGAVTRAHVVEAARCAGSLRAIISIPSILETVARIPRARTRKE